MTIKTLKEFEDIARFLLKQMPLESSLRNEEQRDNFYYALDNIKHILFGKEIREAKEYAEYLRLKTIYDNKP